MTAKNAGGEISPQYQLPRDVLGVGLRLKQILEQNAFLNAKINLTILAEKGRVRYLMTDVNPIEPKAGSLNFMLELLGESPNDGLLFTENNDDQLSEKIRQIVLDHLNEAAKSDHM